MSYDSVLWCPFVVVYTLLVHSRFGFVVRGDSPGCRLISTASMFEWLRNLLPHHSQGSSREKMESKYPEGGHCQSVLRPRGGGGYLTSPFILNNSVETAAPFNVSATHDVVSREINPWKSFDLLRGSNLRPLAPSAGCLTTRPPELTIRMI